MALDDRSAAQPRRIGVDACWCSEDDTDPKYGHADDHILGRTSSAATASPPRVLITGSRTWDRADTIFEKLEGHPRGTVFVHGAARGADYMAGVIARRLGYEVKEYPADWRGKGRRAGIIRNLEMLDTKPDKVIAFWDGRSTGTGHTISEAKKRGIPVEVVT